MDDEFRRKWREAEKAIQKILIDLEHATDKTIDAVNVDTRNYANLRTEIFFEGVDND